MTDLLSSSQFWLLVSIGFYALGVEIQKKTGSAVCNPLLIASILVGALLIATGTPYQTYEESGKLNLVLSDTGNGSACDPDLPQAGCTAEKPAAHPARRVRRLDGIHRQRAALQPSVRSERKHDTFSRAEIGNNSDCGRGSEMLGGVTSITAIAVVITGIIGAIILPTFLKCIGVRNPVQMGLSIGTASHAVGTSRAIELGETEGAISGLAIGVAGLLTALIVSIGSAILL